MPNDALSFSLIEKRLAAIPEGPSAYLGMPASFAVWNAIGVFGAVIGLVPSVLIRFMTPEPWMVSVAIAGLVVEVVGFLPAICYSILGLIRAFWRWRAEHVEQLDHDLAQFRQLSAGLAEFPEDAISAHLQFSKTAQERLAAKSNFMFGSIDRLGILPVGIAIVLQLYALDDAAAVPAWLALAAIFFAVLYMISVRVSQMRIVLQLYEIVLADALHQKTSHGGGGN